MHEWKCNIVDFNNNMKVLHVFGKLSRHGAQLRTLDMLSFGKEKGSDVTSDVCVLSGEPGELDDDFRTLGGSVYLVRIYEPSFSLRFFKLLRSGRYDVVHSHVHHSSGFLLLIAFLAGVRVRIAHYRNMRTVKSQNKLSLARWVESVKRLLTLAFSTKIAAVSHSSLQSALGERWANLDKCSVVYNGVEQPGVSDGETEAFSRSMLGLTENSRLILHVGRFDPQKNHEFLISIFNFVVQSNKNCHLLLVGEGDNDLETQTRGMIDKLGISKNVTFMAPRDDVVEVMKGSDMLLFPSLWEGLPGVVLESLSVGTPVLSSDILPHLEIAGLTSGITICPLAWSADKWANKVLEDLEPVGNLREDIRISFSKAPFTIKKSWESHLELWDR